MACSAATGPTGSLTTTSLPIVEALAAVATHPHGQLSQLLAALPGGDLGVVRYPHPDVLQVLDPRPLLDEAASIAARYGAGGLLIAETLPAGLTHGNQLWFGTPRNVGRALARIAEDLHVDVHVIGPV